MQRLKQANFLKTLRRENQLTQQYLAAFLGIDRSSYAYHESGRGKMTINMISKLAGFYRLPMDDMLRGTGHEPQQTEPSMQLSDQDYDNAQQEEVIANAVKNFNQLSRQEQLLVVYFRSATIEQKGQLLADAEKLVNSESASGSNDQ